jgi:hypothetical protein
MKSLFVIFIIIFTNQTAVKTDEVIPYLDNSLRVEQYESLGMPSPDKVWNASEYKRAVKVIKGYYNVDKWSIPRKNSEYSGTLFERMTKIENFEIIADKTQNIQERLREHDELLRSVGQLMAMYIEQEEKIQRFGSEGLTFRILSARTSIYSIKILKDLQVLMSDRGQRNSDLDLMTDKLVNGVAMTIEENLLIIEADYYQYQTKDLEQFAADLSDWSVEMMTYLAEIKVAELNKKLAVLIENHPNKNVQEILKKMQAKLK